VLSSDDEGGGESEASEAGPSTAEPADALVCTPRAGAPANTLGKGATPITDESARVAPHRPPPSPPEAPLLGRVSSCSGSDASSVTPPTAEPPTASDAGPSLSRALDLGDGPATPTGPRPTPTPTPTPTLRRTKSAVSFSPETYERERQRACAAAEEELLARGDMPAMSGELPGSMPSEPCWRKDMRAEVCWQAGGREGCASGFALEWNAMLESLFAPLHACESWVCGGERK
jgi:hypothetical protein